MMIPLPLWLTAGHNLQSPAELRIVDRMGVYVTVTRADTGAEVELIEEGAGSDEDTARIVKAARRDRRRYTVERIQQALQDDWERERLGLATVVVLPDAEDAA